MEMTDKLRALVDDWLIDVQRRGAELYARNEGSGVAYLSFEGRDHIRYSIDLDYTLGEITLQINNPARPLVICEKIGFTEQNLRSLAKRIARLREGYACVPVSLLVQLTILCHGYQRLVADFDEAKHIQTSTETVQAIKADLQRFLTAAEKRRAENPLLTSGRERNGAKTSK